MMAVGVRTLGHGELIRDLGVELPPIEEFVSLGSLMAVRHRDGHFWRSNFARGPLVYAVVRSARPSSCLEIGTGRGYGALCMAWALDDAGVTDGHVVTLDIVPPDERLAWALVPPEGGEPEIRETTRREIWPIAAPHLVRYVEEVCGPSVDVLRSRPTIRPQVAFIDGDHSYLGTKADFLCVLEAAQGSLTVLFDDYEPRFGVFGFLNDEVFPRFHDECTILAPDGLVPEDKSHHMLLLQLDERSLLEAKNVVWGQKTRERFWQTYPLRLRAQRLGLVAQLSVRKVRRALAQGSPTGSG